MSEREPSRSREVRSQDPSLSTDANRVLTDELRSVVGAERVEVPASRPSAARASRGGRSGFVVELVSNRLVIAMTLLAALVVGAVIALTTGSWWFLLLALGVHALGTLAILGIVLQMTAQVEHLSPTAAARLEQEGVGDPDAVFSDLVEEFAPPTEHGDGERTTPAQEDAAQAAAEQRSAVTPSSDASKPVGP